MIALSCTNDVFSRLCTIVYKRFPTRRTCPFKRQTSNIHVGKCSKTDQYYCFTILYHQVRNFEPDEIWHNEYHIKAGFSVHFVLALNCRMRHRGMRLSSKYRTLVLETQCVYMCPYSPTILKNVLCLFPKICKFECNTTSDWLNHI